MLNSIILITVSPVGEWSIVVGICILSIHEHASGTASPYLCTCTSIFVDDLIFSHFELGVECHFHSSVTAVLCKD